jgi:hypothetical protein
MSEIDPASWTDQRELDRMPRDDVAAMWPTKEGDDHIPLYAASTVTALQEEIGQQERRLRASVLDNASLREENERLKRERDALFSQTGCECDKDECCRYLVQHISRYEAAEARVAELEARLAEAVKVLEPFAAFAQVLDTSGDDGGQSSVCLYAGNPPKDSGWIDRAEENEIELSERLDNDACLFGTVGGWQGVAASFICPVIQAKHLRAARAFIEGSKAWVTYLHSMA